MNQKSKIIKKPKILFNNEKPITIDGNIIQNSKISCIKY